MSNTKNWNSVSVISSYLNETRLQLPEKNIFTQLEDKFKNWKVLDIGVGTGRTTYHLAPLAKEYIGVDYSRGMIEVCKKNFPGLAGKNAIRFGNVCSMDELETGNFDFALFSYNGIDYISHEERVSAFQEILRVIKPGGHFVFSTHNLMYINKLYSIRIKKSLRYSLYQCYHYFRLIFSNGLPGRHQGKTFTILNDGASHFSLKTHYIRPSFQVAQLNALGFTDIKLFSIRNGQEIILKDIDKIKDESWIYYWCRTPVK